MRRSRRLSTAALLLATTALAAAGLSNATCAAILGFEGDYYVDGGCEPLCAGSQYCVSGACTCRPGLTQCGGACVDVTSDGDNCGACDAGCDGALLCSGGKCMAPCSDAGCVGGCVLPDSRCDQGCVDKTSALIHCGTCTQACSYPKVCVMSSCKSD